MKLDHIAGEEMFIDFAGKKLHLVDKETGELIPVEVFVAILPCSVSGLRSASCML